MHGGATLVDNGFEGGGSIEDLGWVDDLAAVGDDGHEAKDETEAVEKRRRAAQNVVGAELHAVADEARVVDDVAKTKLAAGEVLISSEYRRTDG